MTTWSRRDWFALLGLVAAAVAVYLLSESVRYGDSPTYAFQLVHGMVVEPGHLMWRPFGALLVSVLGLSKAPTDALWMLQYVSLGASVAAVAALYWTARRYFTVTAACVAASFFLVSNGYWYYAYSGCSYGLSVLFGVLASSAIAMPHARSPARPVAYWRPFVAGLFCGLSAATWGIQIISAPVIWLGLMLTDQSPLASKTRLLNTATYSAGVLVVLLVPLILLYEFSGAIGIEHFVPPRPNDIGILEWMRSSDHGIPVAFGASQIFRVVVGFPQSIVSIADIAQNLRLWMYGDIPFPWSPWLIVIASFYAIIAYALIRVWRARSILTPESRTLAICTIAAVALNLIFALAWQGTDLERYLPSLPYQALFVGILVSQAKEPQRPTSYIFPIVALALLATVNWLGTFRPVLAKSSYRDAWLTEIRLATKQGDLLLLLGNRKAQIVSPHDLAFPRVLNVSNLILMEGGRWRSTVATAILQTRANGRHIFIADSLLSRDSRPRDGWSFKQNPEPSPAAIAEMFEGISTGHVAFSVLGERVWEAKQ